MGNLSQIAMTAVVGALEVDSQDGGVEKNLL